MVNALENNLCLIKFLDRIDYFLNFSLKEGMSYALTEAMSCGIPSIVSNIPANTEIVNEKNGYILKEYNKNEFDNLSKKIYSDIKNYNNYLIKKKNNLETVNKFLNLNELSIDFINIIKKHSV